MSRNQIAQSLLNWAVVHVWQFEGDQSRAMLSRSEAPRTTVGKLLSITASKISHEHLNAVYPEKRSSVTMKWEC